MLADEVAAVVAAGPATAVELAERLGVSEAQVLYALFSGHGRFRTDRGSPPRWALADSAPSAPPPGSAGMVPQSTGGPGSTEETLGLYPWQTDALASWRARGRRGVVEAVTGTGKTMVGVAAVVEQLARRGQSLVLVPTLELQQQWVDALRRWLPPARPVGRLGAGQAGSLVHADVLVAVINSARVADECHRYASAVNRLGLDPRFTRRLGLSATYGRDDGGHTAWLDPYFGGVCFQMDYRRAAAEKVTAPFSVTLIGVAFGPTERERYDQLTDALRGLTARLVGLGAPPEPFDVFVRAVNGMADGDGPGCQAARAYRQTVLARRRLLADTPAKRQALAGLVPAVRAAQRSIVFTESIASAELAAALLDRRGIPAAAIHSQLPARQRRGVLESFAAGSIPALAAPRVLDEGIDVPAADLAVVIGASRSRRQMIQRMGRVLRRKPDGRPARFAVLFVEGTIEDPRRGAHEAFLDQMLEVAEQVWCFDSVVAAQRRAAVVESLAWSGPG